MSSHYEFREVSPRRKAALALAVICLIAFVALLLPELSRTPLQRPSPVALALSVGLSASSSAIAIVEIAPAMLPSTSAWSDEKHFRFVMLALGVLLVVQFTGVLLALSRYSYSAF
jgi:uncharacterized membrane protein YozB (DUF420 family)